MRLYFVINILLSIANAHPYLEEPLGNSGRCRFGQPCWPDEKEWNAFNQSISGRLVRTLPSAAVCHSEHFDAALCEVARSEWSNSFWRTNQTGAYTAILWELGSGQCFINSTRDSPCDQGNVPHYSVAAKTVEDIQAGVDFAKKRKLYLVVKNTGHDHLGRSSGQGAFAIWTHQLKGREWHKDFVVQNAPKGSRGVSAVTLQAGEQWWDVYHAAAQNNVTIVGGMARTVGAAGGYLTGGGHSMLSHFYGLAVDNLLEVNIVNAQGQHVTLNEYTDSDYFYAIRGGGGSAWGVITSVTYKTHPQPSHIQVAFVAVNSTSNSTLPAIWNKSLKALINITDAGYTGYGLLSTGFLGAFFLPNGTDQAFQTGFAPFAEMSTLPGFNVQFAHYNVPRWIDFVDTFLTDPNIAMNVQDSSRLLTADVLWNKTDQLVDLLKEYEGGFNFIGKVNPTGRDKTSVHPMWEHSRAILSFGIDWADEASSAEKTSKKQTLVDISRRYGKIVGPDGGTYVNEANPYEPDWQNVFWGSKYERLLDIKRSRDPSNLFTCNRCVGSDILFEP